MINNYDQAQEAEPAPVIIKQAESDIEFEEIVEAVNREIDRLFVLWGIKL